MEAYHRLVVVAENIGAISGNNSRLPNVVPSGRLPVLKTPPDHWLLPQIYQRGIDPLAIHQTLDSARRVIEMSKQKILDGFQSVVRQLRSVDGLGSSTDSEVESKLILGFQCRYDRFLQNVRQKLIDAATSSSSLPEPDLRKATGFSTVNFFHRGHTNRTAGSIDPRDSLFEIPISVHPRMYPCC